MSVRDVKMMGEGTISGGQYNKIKIFGDADFLDGVEAESISIFGTAEIREVTAREIKINGTGDFKGNVNSKTIKINGTASFNGRVKAESFVINGETRGDQVLEAEHFVSRGAFRLESLNANDVEIFLAGRSIVKEIGAENVRVNPRSWFMFFNNLFGHSFQELQVDTIEADRIHLENTVAESVKGNQVNIGPGCRIKLVEYKDSITVDPGSKVEETVQI